jgi:YD repeat-containing protein
MKSDREKAGLHGPVQTVRTGGKILFKNSVEPVVDTEWVDGIAIYDLEGRILEESSAERSLVEQEPFRSVYVYGDEGRVTEKRTFNEDGSADGVTKFTYDVEGKLKEQNFTSDQQYGSNRMTYDSRGNVLEISFYGVDGSLKRRETWHYTYIEHGNKLEEHYFIEEEVPVSSPEEAAGWTYYAPFGFLGGESSYSDSTFKRKTPNNMKVINYDDAGRKVEEARYFYERLEFKEKYDAEGRIIEKSAHFNDQGIPHDRSINSYDAVGRLISIHHIMDVRGLNPEPINRKYFYTYDQWGNITEVAAFNEDGTLYFGERLEYEYDSYGNWIKRTKTDLPTTDHRSVTIDDREITYF